LSVVIQTVQTHTESVSYLIFILHNYFITRKRKLTTSAVDFVMRGLDFKNFWRRLNLHGWQNTWHIQRN